MARPRKDPAVLEASGAYAKNPNRRPKDMPAYIPGAPEMPEIVSENDQASRQWNHCCSVLGDANVLTTAYCTLLTVHSMDYARYALLIVSDPESPEVNLIVNRILKQIAEMGMTPASKTKVTAVVGKKEPDSFAEMLARRMGPKAN